MQESTSEVVVTINIYSCFILNSIYIACIFVKRVNTSEASIKHIEITTRVVTDKTCGDIRDAIGKRCLRTT